MARLFSYGLSIGLCLIAFCLNQPVGISQEPKFPELIRDWTEASERGRTIRGQVVKVNPTNVLILVEGSGVEKLIRKSQLCKADQTYLELAPLIMADIAQYEALQATLDAMKLGQFPKAEEIKSDYMKYPKSPYGALLMGVITASTTPDYEEAEPYFERAYKSVAARHELVRNILPATFVTCCNNYAIVQWRLGGASNPVKLLHDASRFSINPSIIGHNTTILAAENAKRGDKYQLPKRNESLLKETIAANFAPPAKPLETGVFHFSLNVEPPPSLEELEELIANAGSGGGDANPQRMALPPFSDLLACENCPYEPWCMSCSGRGVFRCSGGCVRGSISVPNKVLEAVSVNGTPIYSTRFVQEKCTRCNGSGAGDRCGKCDGTGRHRSGR
jgi:hypothetical protein